MSLHKRLLALAGCALATLAHAEPQVYTYAHIQATAGMSIAADGTLYIADFGDINTLAGVSLYRYSPEGELALVTDSLRGPAGNIITDDGSLLQSEYLRNRIVRIDADGNVSNFAQVPAPDDIASEGNGNYLVASCPFDGTPPGIYRVDADGNTAPVSLSADYGCSSGVTVDDRGEITFTSFSEGNVYRIDSSGSVRIFATLPSPGSHIKFANDQFYVISPRINQIFTLSRDGVVAPLAGTGQSATIDGPASQAAFQFPFHIEISPDGRYLFVDGGPGGDQRANPVRVIDLFPERGEPILAPRLLEVSSVWFDPENGGEGMVAARLRETNQVWVQFLSYANDGTQRWYVGLGALAGASGQLDLYTTRGGRLRADGSFDRSDYEQSIAGSLSLSMPDCESLALSFEIGGQSGQRLYSRAQPLPAGQCY